VDRHRRWLPWLLAATLCGCAGSTAAPIDPPRPGELLIVQLHLVGLSTGESTLVVGPDGGSVLIDVGNDSHADEITAALGHYLGEAAVDHVLLTHYHADHIGGFDELFQGEVDVRGTVISRGPVGLHEGGANLAEWAEVEDTGLEQIALCSTETTCDGLADATLDLGDGSVLQLLAANGVCAGEQIALAPGSDDDENARSLVGLLTWGEFAWLFGGDLTGGGKDTLDVESFVAERAEDLLPDDGVNVLKLNHHGIDSSTNAAWLDRLLPADDTDRHAVVGANRFYLSAPNQDVLDRIGDRLGDGGIWVPEPGSLAGSHPRLREVQGDVAIRIGDGGGSYVLE